MKKAFVLIISIFCLVCSTALLGCAKEQTVSVTFKQDGYDDVVITIDKGGLIDEVPTPKSRIGYTVTWDRTDFSNINEDTVVSAVETPNVYTVTFNLFGGTLVDQSGNAIANSTYEYTYDAQYSFPGVKRDGYNFNGWYAWKMRVPDQEISHIYSKIDEQGIWNICNEKDGVRSIIIYATWSYDIIFRQQGFEDVVLTFVQTPNGSTEISESDIPNPKNEIGYKVTWEPFNISDLTKNTTINAVKTANTYKVYFDLESDEHLPDGFEFDSTQNKYYTEVKYGNAYTLPTPTKDGYDFVKWLYNGQALTSDVWNIAQDVTLTPDFTQQSDGSFTITFVLGEGNPEVKKTLESGQRLTAEDIPQLPTATGYVFSWQIGGVPCTQEDILNLSSTTTVTAVKTAKQYVLRYNAGEHGTIDKESVTVTYGQPVTFDTPTPNDDAIFQYWTLDGSELSNAYSAWEIDCDAEEELIAVWTFERTLRVYIDTIYDVTVPNEWKYDEERHYYYIEVERGTYFDLTTLLPTYIKDASTRYDFVEWLMGGEKFTGREITSNITLTARWINSKDGSGWSDNR